MVHKIKSSGEEKEQIYCNSDGFLFVLKLKKSFNDFNTLLLNHLLIAALNKFLLGFPFCILKI